jgi:hypothetical protein
VFTTAYRPTTNGQVERWNATLVDMVAHIATEKNWDQCLGLACTSYNSTVHTTTGYAPVELASTRDPFPSVWSRQPDLSPRSKGDTQRLRHHLLARAEKLRRAAQETMTTRLARYKKLYDYHVRRRHTDLELGDSVLVKTHVLEPGRSSKLSVPVAGPYPVVKIQGVKIGVRTREGVHTLHLDRVIPCPVDLPPGVDWAPKPITPLAQPRPPRESDDEYVIERFVSHARAADDSCWLIRVRWASYGADADTWEPSTELPEHVVRKYERKKRLSPRILTRVEAPAIGRSRVH